MNRVTGKTRLKGPFLKIYLGIHGNQEDLQISMAVWLSLDQLAAHEEKRQQKERGGENKQDRKKWEGKKQEREGEEHREEEEKEEGTEEEETEEDAPYHSFDNQIRPSGNCIGYCHQLNSWDGVFAIRSH